MSSWAEFLAGGDPLVVPSVKVCGVTRGEDLELLVEAGMDAVGFNFWPKSKRFLAPEKRWELADIAKGRLLRVGLFVNQAEKEILTAVSDDLIDVVQLHGDQTLDDVRRLLDREIRVIHAVSAKRLPPELPLDPNLMLLIDTPAGADYGGTGKTFDWSIARDFCEQHPGLPVALAGGLKPENIVEAWQTVRPSVLDVASGVESAPGVKDREKTLALMKNLRGAKR